ncbi:putative phosphatase [Nostoc sp. PCC 7524]|uniref:PhoX family protein n=1 Tax=Nostoc sp. (strain ATCC 29411 / PCC 7524) TaxID=28072 RepID=UPI00029EE5E7|nr:PhoX family phosphatase [Nostoc sp. PCC 7524]AFY46132.1 putative phosphatase [Nostoc sp. PCC 7524]
MKGRFHPRNDATLNPSRNESIRDVIDRVSLSRRRFIMTAVGTSVLTVVGEVSIGGFLHSVEASPIPAKPGFGGIGFKSVPPNLNPDPTNPSSIRLEKDLVSVPEGYTAKVLLAWGDPIMPGAPDWKVDASQDAAAQEMQVGMHHDGMHYFSIPPERVVGRSVGALARSFRNFVGQDTNKGLLCINHEYTHEEILHVGGLSADIAKIRKSQAAHGVSVVEINKTGNTWSVNRNSIYGRRYTANTEMRVSGPAAGDDLLKSKKFNITPTGSVEIGINDGYTAYGTVNNCANGYTPWGTYLTCEENWNGYFANPTGDVVSAPGLDQKPEILAGQSRYGISRTGFGYRWHEVDPRFDASTNPLEPHLFGWVVEIDPYDPDPTSKAVKRTAMGRFKHESAQYVVDDNNYVAFYMGDDERNEYIYKFVCSQRYNPGNRAANRDLLDDGVLYVAKFNDNGTGEWIPLIYGQGGLTPENGFRSQAEVLIKTRQAADRVGATMMDRPEWTAVRPRLGGFREIEVYCTLTNNSRRGTNPPSSNSPNGTTAGGSARPPVDDANPRANNIYGHIIRWRETGRTVKATTFSWDIFVECGDKLDSNPNEQGNIIGDDYGAPDGLWFDDFGRLWIQTDQAGDGRGDWVNIGGNVMMCADPVTKQTKRFLTSPTDCEVTGITTTPDGRTMFINIQHPGEGAPADNPTRTSDWPHTQGYGPSGRPRSGTVVITRNDGGIIGGL